MTDEEKNNIKRHHNKYYPKIIRSHAGSGKKMTINIMNNFFPPGERIIIIEDSGELDLKK